MTKSLLYMANIKTFYITLILIIMYNGYGFSQCAVQVNERDDGVTVKYLDPVMVGKGDMGFLGLSLQTNGEDYFLCTTTVFKDKATKLDGNLTMKFSNNKSSVLEHFQSVLTTTKGYPTTVSIFIIDKNDLLNIMNENISIVTLQLESGIIQTVFINSNYSNILKRHYKCLNNL